MQAATFTWDGGAGNGEWEHWTGQNWDTNTNPINGSDIVFAGSTQTNVTNIPWGRQINSLTFASGASAFTLNGGKLVINGGGITNNSSNTQTIDSRIELAANQTWNAANGAIVSNDSYFNATNKNLTLTGGSAITIAGQVANMGALTVSGSGNRTFSSTSTMSASSVTVNGTGTTTFASQVNATTISLSSGSTYFNQTGTSAQIGSGGINISGTANAYFAGNVGSSGGYTISSSGNVTFNSNITSGNLTLNGTGTTTINGGSNNIGTTTVNSGTLIMDSSGTSTNGPLVVNGGNVIMEGTNQVPTWSSITLTGGTLDLNDNSQTIANLTITGDAIIDFGNSGSALNVTGNISIADGITITIKNWNDTLDVFSGSNPGDDVVVNIEYADNDGNVYATGTWGSNLITPGAPVPEPATYGLLLVGGLVTLVANRRPRRAA